MVDFTVTLTNTEESGLSSEQLDLLERSALVAANLWGQYIDAPKVTLDFEFNLGWTDTERASGRAFEFMFLETNANNQHIFNLNTTTKLNGEADFTGNNADFWIALNPISLSQVYAIDSEPETRTGEIPLGRTDITSILLHEIGHALGFDGMHINESIETVFTKENLTQFESLLEQKADGIYFTGQAAQKLAGRPIELAIEPDNSHGSHLGNLPVQFSNQTPAPGFGSDLGAMVMHGLFMVFNVRYHVTALDIAILEDLGVPIRKPSQSDDRLFGFESPDPGLELEYKTPNADFLNGNDEIAAKEGNDVVQGLSGQDTLKGEAGDDTL
ncbi:MAG: hypothetical protein AB3N28_02610, partial [Kordiimonas sp.]